MDEYINRDTLVGEFIEKQFKNNSSKIEISEVIRMINSQPKADVVEIVRCKDCEFCKHSTVGYLCKRILNMTDGEYFIYNNPNDYCSYGERKIDND